MNGSNLKEEQEKRKRPEFSTWLLSLPPINLYNIELVYLAFGYDMRYDLSVARRDLKENRNDK